MVRDNFAIYTYLHSPIILLIHRVPKSLAIENPKQKLKKLKSSNYRYPHTNSHTASCYTRELVTMIKVISLQWSFCNLLVNLALNKPLTSSIKGHILQTELHRSLIIYIVGRICLKIIDHIHKWRPRNYSFVFVLIILTSLTLKEKFF